MLQMDVMADLVCGDEVPDEQKDAHHDVLGDGDDVGTGDLHDLQALLGSHVEVNMVGPDTSGHAELEVVRLQSAVSTRAH